MMTGNLSKEEIKKQIEGIRWKRKLSEIEKIKAIRKQFAEDLSIVHDALDSSISGVIITNLSGKIIYVNNTFLRIFDYEKKTEVLGKNAADLFVEESITKLSDVKAIIDKAEGEVEEFAVRRKDGTIFPVEVSSSNVSDSSEKIVGRMASFFDISKRKKAEEDKRKLEVRIQEAQKLESISTLAGGVAHEINNALQIIIACMELLQVNCEPRGNLKEYFLQIEASTNRMSQLITQLLAFAKGGRYQAIKTSLNHIVEEGLMLIQHAINPAVRIEKHLAENIQKIEVDPIQVKMVTSAVVLNAVEAIHGPGIIKVCTENRIIDRDFAKNHDNLETGHYVVLIVEDNGTGMDEKTKERIFDPFFTTKFQGRGLGMAAAYGIVKNYGGAIEVESEAKKGTIVRIYLPVGEA